MLAFATAHLSGGQLNPAVSLGLVLTGGLGPLQFLCNVAAQVRPPHSVYTLAPFFLIACIHACMDHAVPSSQAESPRFALGFSPAGDGGYPGLSAPEGNHPGWRRLQAR